MCSAGTSFPWSFSLPDFPISLSKSVAFRTALLWNSGHQFPWQLWLQVGMPELELPPGFQKPFPKGGESALSQHDPSGLKQPRLPGVRNESFILVGSIFPPGIALPVFWLFPGDSTACSSHFCGILGIVLPASFPPPPEGAKLGSSNALWEQPRMSPDPLEKSQVVVSALLPWQGILGFHQHSRVGSFPVFLLAPAGIPARTGLLA